MPALRSNFNPTKIAMSGHNGYAYTRGSGNRLPGRKASFHIPAITQNSATIIKAAMDIRMVAKESGSSVREAIAEGRKMGLLECSDEQAMQLETIALNLA